MLRPKNATVREKIRSRRDENTWYMATAQKKMLLKVHIYVVIEEERRKIKEESEREGGIRAEAKSPFPPRRKKKMKNSFQEKLHLETVAVLFRSRSGHFSSPFHRQELGIMLERLKNKWSSRREVGRSPVYFGKRYVSFFVVEQGMPSLFVNICQLAPEGRSIRKISVSGQPSVDKRWHILCCIKK